MAISFRGKPEKCHSAASLGEYMIATIAMPRLMRIGAGASLELGSILSQLGLSRPLIVTDSHLVELGKLSKLMGSLDSSKIRATLFSDVVLDPTVTSVEACLAFLRAGDYDCVVGFGGGSSMDTAKAVAVLAVHGGAMSSYKVPHVQDSPGLPIIAIPTTAGTGSETTRFTIISDEKTNEKMLCVGLGFLPTAALVDYEQTFTMPKGLTAATGLDALCHALEGYVSKRSHPFSQNIAAQAMRAIAPNLRRAYADPLDRFARETVMLGASLAGIAFSNSSVALIHGMARPIGAFFHVAHGLSVAMLMPAVIEFSAPADIRLYANASRAMGLAAEDESNESAVSKLVNEFIAFNTDLEVPTPKSYGIDPGRWTSLLGTMAEQALASGSPANNPRPASTEEILQLYKQAWAGEESRKLYKQAGA
ncbi:MAG: iron-containing alcohol dehydrogenase [Candidatus Korobacteraceae bacterium]|jgi:alcohol dehydrogenase class IV